VENELHSDNYAVFLVNSSGSVHKQDTALRRIVESRMDGVLLSPAAGTTAQDLDWLIASRFPIVTATRRVPGLKAAYVGANDVRAGSLAAGHLVELGHKRIAFACGLGDSESKRNRLKGIRKTLAEHGLEITEDLAFHASRGEASRNVDALLNIKRNRPTAVICFNDIVALGVLDALHRHGLVPGRDLSVVGIDDIAEASENVPPLTTVSNRPAEIARTATRLLLQLIENPDEIPRARILAGSLAVRSTTGPPRG
jgi:LacI family transcriptional regulator